MGRCRGWRVASSEDIGPDLALDPSGHLRDFIEESIVLLSTRLVLDRDGVPVDPENEKSVPASSEFGLRRLPDFLHFDGRSLRAFYEILILKWWR